MSEKRKVFLLWGIAYDASEILGIFLFRERAEKELQKYIEECWWYGVDNLFIEEMELDENE